jgi:fructoselysine-6-P-deglycase FrlB-like protein
LKNTANQLKEAIILQEHIQQLNQAIAAITSYPVRNFFFVACGGSMATLTPGQYVMEQESDTRHLFILPTSLFIAIPTVSAKAPL